MMADALEELRAAVALRLHAIEDPGAVAAGDEGDLSVHYDTREFAIGDRSRLQEQLRRIDRAIARAKAGDYGVCLDCGLEIKAGRLRAIPEAETCVECQALRERLEEPAQDRVTRSRIGSEEE
jgi:DnaK suppressor protein